LLTYLLINQQKHSLLTPDSFLVLHKSVVHSPLEYGVSICSPNNYYLIARYESNIEHILYMCPTVHLSPSDILCHLWYMKLMEKKKSFVCYNLGVVSKLLNISSTLFYHLIAPLVLVFYSPNRILKMASLLSN